MLRDDPEAGAEKKIRLLYQPRSGDGRKNHLLLSESGASSFQLLQSLCPHQVRRQCINLAFLACLQPRKVIHLHILLQQSGEQTSTSAKGLAALLLFCVERIKHNAG